MICTYTTNSFYHFSVTASTAFRSAILYFMSITFRLSLHTFNYNASLWVTLSCFKYLMLESCSIFDSSEFYLLRLIELLLPRVNYPSMHVFRLVLENGPLRLPFWLHKLSTLISSSLSSFSLMIRKQSFSIFFICWWRSIYLLR